MRSTARAARSLSLNDSEKILSWEKLRMRNNMQITLADLGVTEKSRVVVALPNSLGAVISTLGAWRLGACVFFLSYELVSSERKALLEQVQPVLVVSTWKNLAYKTLTMPVTLDYSLNTKAVGRVDIVSFPARAMATASSPGMPKIILEEAPLIYGVRFCPMGICYRAASGTDAADLRQSAPLAVQ